MGKKGNFFDCTYQKTGRRDVHPDVVEENVRLETEHFAHVAVDIFSACYKKK